MINGRIDARFQAVLSSARIAIVDQAVEGRLAGVLKETLAGISDLDLRADIDGDLDDYRVRLSSNIDDTLKNAMAKQLKQKAGAFEKGLKDAVAEKTRQPLAENSRLFSDLSSVENELTSRLGLGDALRKSGLK